MRANSVPRKSRCQRFPHEETESPSGIQVVILCGGRGTRLGRVTDARPKPMVEIGDKPILWHIMKQYAHYGFKDFILCLGYRGEVIRNYFLDYLTSNCDFTINLGNSGVTFHTKDPSMDWSVTLVDTGLNSMTGARVKRIESYVGPDLFMLTYGDGVSDVNLKALLRFHRQHGKIGTVSGVQPTSIFGELNAKDDQVVEFREKARLRAKYVSGGFFVFSKKFLEYLTLDDNCVLEKSPLEQLAKNGELMIYKHHGFWQCMDTVRDLEKLNNLWCNNIAPWKTWK